MSTPLRRVHPRTLFTAVVAMLCGSFVLGCSQWSRIDDCKRFVQLANRSVAELRAHDGTNLIAPSSDGYERLAARFDDFHRDLDGLGIDDRELAQAVGNVSKTMQTTANDCRTYAKQLAEFEATAKEQGRAKKRKRDVTKRKLKKTHAQVTRSLRNYKAQVARVNALCQPSR